MAKLLVHYRGVRCVIHAYVHAYIDVVEEQAAEEVKGEGDKSTDVEAKSADVEADIFVKLSSHQLSDNGTYVCLHIHTYVRTYGTMHSKLTKY